MDEINENLSGLGMPATGVDPLTTPGLGNNAPVDLAAAATLPDHLSPWAMFLSADPIVQAVMIGLVVASIATWTIWLAKSIEIARARRGLSRALDIVSSAASLQDAAARLGSRRAAETLLVGSGLTDLKRAGDVRAEGLKDSIAIRLERLQAGASRKIALGTGLLATIGATAPFVGLFGTVWGIMNSFIGISKAQTTNLAVVAPGIAEALLATGLGLVAAIPAVVIYNIFARAISAYRAQLADLAAEVMRHVISDLDSVRAPRMKAAE